MSTGRRSVQGVFGLLTTIVNGVFTGPGLAVVFVVVMLILTRWPGRKARVLGWTLAVGYLLSTVFAVPQAIGWLLLTHRFHEFSPSDVPPGRVAIVLLGGGTDTVHGWNDATLADPSGDGLERVLEASRVFGMTHADWIISSGGNLDPRQEKDAVTMRDQLVRIGVPADRILLEADSQTTHDQAVLVAPMLHRLGAQQVILVTSDIHMPRSLGTFRASDVNAIPAIAPNTVANAPLVKRFLPSVEGFERSQQVEHELVGIPYYAVRGWWR